MKLLEILRNRLQTVKWVKEGSNRFVAEFNVDEEEFYIQVDVLQGTKKYVSISFGKFDERGFSSTKATPSKKAIITLNVVITAVKDLLTKLQVDVVVFAAKEKDGSFSSRSSLYTAIARRLERETKWSLFTRIKGELGVYVLSKEPLDKADMKYVRETLGIKKK